MIWPATHGQSWRSGPSCEVALDGARLRARRGHVHWDIDLSDSSVSVTFHHWGLGRGTVALVKTGEVRVAIASEGFPAAELDYHAPLAKGPDLILQGSHFDAMVASLPTVFLDRDKTIQTYWLWRNGFRMATAFRPILYVFAFILASGLCVRVKPTPLAAGLSAVLFLGLIMLEVNRGRRMRRPAMRLVLDGSRLSLARADSGTSLGQCPYAELTVRSARWTAPPAGRSGAVTILDMPMVIIEGIVLRPLSIGGSVYWGGTGGPKLAPPQFLVSPVCWTRFAESLLPKHLPLAAPAPQARDSTGQPSRRS